MTRNFGVTQATSRAETTEEQVRAYELRLAGKTIRYIAADLDCSIGKAHGLIDREIEARKWPVVAKWRDLEIARLEDLWDRLRTRLDQADDDEAFLRIVDRMDKIASRRAKLLGLDAPVQVQATVQEVTQQDLELDELLREERTRAQLAENSIKNGAGE